MPSPTSGFFGGLAQGIFGKMAEHEKMAREEGLKKREQTLNYLTGMLDQTTPETRPILMQQISDVMGLKGKQRGVWDMLTGKGRQNYSDALGGKLSEITGSVVGPEQYAKLKGGLQQDFAQAPTANGPAWASQALVQAPDQTAGKIALIDPRADRLAQIREQYGAMREAGLEKMELQNQFTNLRKEDEQAFRMQMAEREQYNKAFGPVYKQAATIAASKGRMKLDPQDLEEAAQQIATLGGLNVDKLKAQIGLSQAKKIEAEANAQAAGLGTGDPFAGMKPGERARFDQSQQQAAQGIHKQWTDAYSQIQQIDSQQKSLRDRLKGTDPVTGYTYKGDPSYEFDETKGTFVRKGTGVALEETDKIVGPLVMQLKKLQAEKQAVMAQLQQHARTLQSQYPDYYKVEDEWRVSPNAGFGGVSPSGAPRTGQIYDATTRPGANIADMQEVIGSQARPSSNYKVGQIVSISGKKYTVTSVTPPTEDRPHGSYILQAVR